MRTALLLIIFPLLVSSAEYAVVTSAQTPVSSLSQKFVRDLFLKKRTFFESTELFAINLSPQSPIRGSFEKEVLGMDRDELNEYWIVSHYKGIKPPIVQRSEAGVREFVKNRANFIGYLPKTMVDKSMKVLYEF